jgi:hypothetical protein
LEQGQSLIQRGIVTPLQELHGLFYLRTHCRKCSMANSQLDSDPTLCSSASSRNQTSFPR